MGIPDHLTCLLRNLYAGLETTVRTRYGTMDWFQIGKGVCQCCILSPSLFNLHAEYIMWNAGLGGAQTGISIAGRNINNLNWTELMIASIVCVCVCVCVLVAPSCPTLCHPVDYRPPVSSVHGVLQARILEWTVTSFSKGFSCPRDRTWVSCIAGRFFTIWAIGKSLWYLHLPSCSIVVVV